MYSPCETAHQLCLHLGVDNADSLPLAPMFPWNPLPFSLSLSFLNNFRLSFAFPFGCETYWASFCYGESR